MPLAGHEHVVKAPLAGFEGLFHRVQAVENFHGLVYGAGEAPISRSRWNLLARSFRVAHEASTKRRIPANAPSGVAASQESGWQFVHKVRHVRRPPATK